MPKALITGVSGQDGAYIAKILLDRGYTVVGTARPNSTRNDWRLRELGIADRVRFVLMELHEFSSVLSVLNNEQPQIIFNLAAQSFVDSSFRQPIFTADIDAHGPLRILEAIRAVDKNIRLFQASSSEMFGNVENIPQNEGTSFHPVSPYGVAKLFAHWSCINYSDGYGMYAASGILFNHESPLRGPEFVSRKITGRMVRVKKGELNEIVLGNLAVERDWGHARDYAEGIIAMMEQDRPDSFVFATGQMRSIRDFVDVTAQCLGMKLKWEGSGIEETAIDQSSNRIVVRVDPNLYRSADRRVSCGDASKAKRVLGWSPRTSFEQLVEEMIRADYRGA